MDLLQGHFEVQCLRPPFSVSVRCPLFDPGELSLLDFDEATEQKIKGDAVFDKKLKLNAERRLDLFYVIAVGNLATRQQLFGQVPLKSEFALEDVSFAAFNSLPDNFEVDSSGAFRLTRNRSKRTKVEDHTRGFFKSLGVGSGLHNLVLETAMELEKQNYRTWLEEFAEYFEKR